MPRRLNDTPIQLLPVYCFATGLLRFGVLNEEPQNATALRARPLWTIVVLSVWLDWRAGVGVGARRTELPGKVVS